MQPRKNVPRGNLSLGSCCNLLLKVRSLSESGDIMLKPFSTPALPAMALAASSELIRLTAAAALDVLHDAVTQVSNSTAATLSPYRLTDDGNRYPYVGACVLGALLIAAGGGLAHCLWRHGACDTDRSIDDMSPSGSRHGSGTAESRPHNLAPPTYDEATLPTYEEAMAASPAAPPMPAHEVVLTPALFLSGTSSGASDT